MRGLFENGSAGLSRAALEAGGSRSHFQASHWQVPEAQSLAGEIVCGEEAARLHSEAGSMVGSLLFT